MTAAAHSARDVLPRQLTSVMIPELGSLASAIAHEIRAAIPEYATPDGPYRGTVKIGVEQALTGFVARIGNPATPNGKRDEVCRQLGRYEALAGRSLDCLQAAYRIGARMAWQRIMKVGRRHNFSSAIMSHLADSVFQYMDELASLSFEGYVEARARTAGAVEQWRRRLLRMLLEQPPAGHETITELAQSIGWAVPTHAALVVARADEPHDHGDSGKWGADVLTEVKGIDLHLLYPAPVARERLGQLAVQLPACRIAIGPVLALDQAALSLRWAQQALGLVESGAIEPRDGITHCDDHLLALWLDADQQLVERMARKRLGPLAGLTRKQRLRLTETLDAWLRTRGSAPEVAEYLDVHPQTVRYRMRQLEALFGPQLDDPDARLELELVLRAQQLGVSQHQAGTPRARASTGQERWNSRCQ